jgi:exopolyphosphatase/guanosine-5'-triphosphate,3'-diphosphate pyrophosphatase
MPHHAKAMRCACVDIGSNTTRLLVAAREDGRTRIVHAERAFVALAPAAAGGAAGAAVSARLAAVVAGHVAVAREHGAQAVHVVGTAALRGAADRAALVAAVEAAAGLPVRILSGEEEARLTFAGALATLEPEPAGPVGVADVGGGSSELMVGTAAEGVTWSSSLPVGSGVLIHRHVREDPPGPAELQAMRAAVAEAIGALDVPVPDVALAVGGSAVSLARVAGGELDPEGLERALALLCAEPAARVAARTGLPELRVRLLPAGLLLLAGASRAFGAPLQVAPGGLREGVVAQAFSGATREPG